MLADTESIYRGVFWKAAGSNVSSLPVVESPAADHKLAIHGIKPAFLCENKSQ